MAIPLQVRHDTSANWGSENPVLLDGEIAVTEDTPRKVKIGDGTTSWNDLPYIDSTAMSRSDSSAASLSTLVSVAQSTADAGGGGADYLGCQVFGG